MIGWDPGSQEANRSMDLSAAILWLHRSRAGPDTLKDETALLPLPGPKAGICGPVCYDHFSDGTQQS